MRFSFFFSGHNCIHYNIHRASHYRGKEAGGASRLLLHPKDKLLLLRSCQALTMTSSCLHLQQGSSCKTLPLDTRTRGHRDTPRASRPRGSGISAVVGFFTGGFSTERTLLFYSEHSSTQHPNFLLTKKFIRKLSSQSQPWQ